MTTGHRATPEEPLLWLYARPAIGLLAGALVMLLLEWRTDGLARAGPLLVLGFVLCFGLPVWAVLESVARLRRRAIL